MYCTIEDLRNILPEPISIGDQNIGTPSPGRPNSNRDVLTPVDAIRFIRLAEQEIDARLRPYYVCPLRRIKTFETEILDDVSAGTDVEVKIHDTGVFSKGQMVRLQSTSNFETSEIASITDLHKLVLKEVENGYDANESRISILEFPDPIPFIAARLAVSYAFDRLFSAEQSPNISEYGKTQRNLAINSFDSILTGTTLLFGQDHTGRRFVRGSVHDAFQTPTPDFQFGREKSQ